MSAEIHGARVVLRPLAPEDAGELRRIREAPEVERWWAPPEPDFPLGDEPESTRFAVLVEGEVAGMVQFSEEAEPTYRHAEIDIFLDPAFHGRGLGTEVVTALARHLNEDREHHRVVISAAVENEVAIRCYEKAGFRRVGRLEASWRDHRTGEWRDEILLERVTR